MNQAVLVLVTIVPVLLAVVSGDLGSDRFTPGRSSVAAYAPGEPDFPASVWTRLGTWSIVTLVGGPLSFAGHAAVLLGFVTARHRVLEEPYRHLRPLRWTAVLGVTIGWLGGLPTALANLGHLDLPAEALSDSGVLIRLQTGTGRRGPAEVVLRNMVYGRRERGAAVQKR